MSWQFYEPTVRRAAKGGIVARSRRGSFGETWWGKRWMEALEQMGMESRLARGRSYARSGQVLTLTIETGKVNASVLGSAPRPYRIAIGLAVAPDATWTRFSETLAEHAGVLAALLAGELSPETEALARVSGLPLFPGESLGDLKATCSCPDWGEPCKHVAAVYCLLAEEFDRDPFLLFQLRGRDREKLLASLVPAASVENVDPASRPEPLPTDPAGFWDGGPSRELYPERQPGVSATLVRRLGPFPFWRSAVSLEDAIAPICEKASERQSRQ